MTRAHSIDARLSVVFLFLFVLVIVVGAEGLRSLSQVDDASAQIRFRWLPSTHALGDLNNLTTDFPAAENALLHAGNDGERAAALRQMRELDHGIAAAQATYAQIPHDPPEEELYRRFEARWSEYRGLVASGAAPGTDTTRAAYEEANATLQRLTERNLAGVREASERSEMVYGQARMRIALTVLLAGMLVAGAMAHITRSISGPLVDLAERMHRLAATETAIEVKGTSRRDEIGEMARAVVVFRNNAIDLATSRRALAEQADMLQQKLAAERQLTLLQRNFVSMASHEFRTPLAIIDGHAQRLVSMRDRLTPEELTERARKVRDTVRRMTQLIDNLIGSARLFDGRMDLHCQPRPIEIGALVVEACRLQKELSPDADIQAPVVSAGFAVDGDPGLLSQAFGNLLANAVKYSPAGGAIRVSVRAGARHATIVIEDRGIGIAASDRRRVFEPYYRGSNTAGIVGSGVGLYLVRRIVDLHGGDIAVDSSEGAGSRFTLRLPVSRAGSDADAGARHVNAA